MSSLGQLASAPFTGSNPHPALCECDVRSAAVAVVEVVLEVEVEVEVVKRNRRGGMHTLPIRSSHCLASSAEFFDVGEASAFTSGLVV